MNYKMIVVTGLIVGIITIALLIAPIHAYVNGASRSDALQVGERDKLKTRQQDCKGNMLQTQTRERLKIRDCYCNSSMLQSQEQHQMRIQNHSCTNECIQHFHRQRVKEGAANGLCGCTKNMG
jgi:hypothetical protein